MTSASASVPGRDRFLDLLRAVALVRVVTFHTFDADWLSVAFPAMGVMFAMAGSLMARSLARPAAGVLRRRARRLLLPLWVYAAIMLSLLTAAGWRPLEEGVSWPEVLMWFVPLGDAPYPDYLAVPEAMGEEWGVRTGVILWYVRTYFWLMLASPLLLWAFRRRPWVTLLAPLGLLVILTSGVVEPATWLDGPLTDFATFGACWILGFAHRDGLLHTLRPPTLVILAAASMTLGMTWAVTHAEETLDLNDLPLGQALWSLGFVAVLLRVSPQWSSFPARLRFLDRPVTLLNNRALTVYLWHFVLLAATFPLVGVLWRSRVLRRSVPELLRSEVPSFLLVWVLLAVVIVAVGWVEDVAARRRPQLWPDGRASRDAAGG